MIREDRIQLNDRFVRVFKLLEERGDIVLNDRKGKGIGDFANRILGNRAYGHIIRAFLNPNDKRVIDYRHARTLCQEYGVNESYMLDGEGEPFGMQPPAPRQIGTEHAVLRGGNILYTSVQAFAGSGVDTSSETREQHSFFSLPGLEGDGLVAFPIEGDSMEPVISDGDVIICRQISGAHEVKENHIYAVKSNGSLWVKYLQPIKGKRGRITGLKLISANYLEYDPFEEEVNEYTRLYVVIRKISQIP
ncbi:MAG: S24 family peptidase [Saprospiraceae bacterium]|jgi:hypothetical protein